MTTRQRHPNRAGLRAVPSTTTAGGPVLACRCPVKIVTGTAWAYDRRLGWHDPAEHGTWTPPRRPTRAPLPPALLQRSNPAPEARPRPPDPPSPEEAGRRHVLAPAGPTGLVVCLRCALVFDATAFTRTRAPLPPCQPPAGPAPASATPTVHSDTAREDT